MGDTEQTLKRRLVKLIQVTSMTPTVMNSLAEGNPWSWAALDPNPDASSYSEQPWQAP